MTGNSAPAWQPSPASVADLEERSVADGSGKEVSREDSLGLMAKRQTDYRHLRLDRRDLKLLAFRAAMLTKRSAGNGRTAISPFGRIRTPARGYE
jgi:hypothetical protein